MIGRSATSRDAKHQVEQMRRHVMSCRRRGDTAAVLVVKLPERARAKLAGLAAAFRVTDSVTVARGADGPELRAVVDGRDLECDAVERRIQGLLGDIEPVFGWSFFPQDGVTLEALIESARHTGARPDHRLPQGGLPAPAPAVRDRTQRNGVIPGDAGRTLSRVVVTGCAGFLGSQLSERLVADGREVVGVDCFTDYYPRLLKEANLERLRDEARFHFREIDLSADDLSGLLEGVDTVVHLAAQPGVRSSFGRGFDAYVRNNIQATQRLLEEAARWPLGTFTYASSSSVYGDSVSFPTDEQAERNPVSPYGMTKVATEELAAVYHRSFRVPVVGLRYFTAYGPRQRPDMAFRRFLVQALSGEVLSVYGDGRQVREFTYVDDVIEATVAACRRGRAGAVYNVGGGTPVELRDALALIEELIGRPLVLDRQPAQIGEARTTSCDGSLAERDLGFVPGTDLRQGIVAQLEWMLGLRDLTRAAEPVASLVHA